MENDEFIQEAKKLVTSIETKISLETLKRLKVLMLFNRKMFINLFLLVSGLQYKDLPLIIIKNI